MLLDRYHRSEGPDFAAGFAIALADPEKAAPAVLVGPSGSSAGKRFDIYRNNVAVSLIDALASIYPAVQRLTGEDFFRAMARFHIRETPPRSPLLFEYGRDFPDFIARYEYAQELPWLADVARIERAWLDAYHAADAEPLDVRDLASMPPDRLSDLQFVPHPATRIVRSDFSAATIFVANRSDEAVGTIDASRPEAVLITRPLFEVTVRRLPPGGAIFLQQLCEKAPLGEASASALAENPDFDIGAAITAMTEAGAFITLRLRDEP